METQIKVGWYGWVDVDDPKGYGWSDVDPKGKVGVCVSELVTAGETRRHKLADIRVTIADDTAGGVEGVTGLRPSCIPEPQSIA